MSKQQTEIKLDYDLKWYQVKAIFRKRGWILKKLGLKKLLVYKTKRGYHVYAIINAKLRQYETGWFQSLMDSDPNREILNFLRYKKYKDMRNFLFDVKSFYTNSNCKKFRFRRRMIGLERQLQNIVEDKEVKI